MNNETPRATIRRKRRQSPHKEARIERLVTLLQALGPRSLTEVERELGVSHGTAVTDRREAYRRLGWPAPGGPDRLADGEPDGETPEDGK